MLICDKCGYHLIESNNYCPQCGDPVDEMDIREDHIVTGDSLARLSFGYSTSVHYGRAVSICENIPTYRTEGDGRQIMHVVDLSLNDVELIANLYDIVGSWKSSSLIVKGQSIGKRQLSYYGLGCFRSRLKSVDKDGHCFGMHQFERNIWGCKKLELPISEWGGGWLDHGQFDGSGAWVFDKDLIKKDIESRSGECELCPIFNKSLIMETVDRLPLKIQPKTDSNWEYASKYRSLDDGGYEMVAVGVKPILSKASEYVLYEHKPAWNDREADVYTVTTPRETYPESDADRSKGKEKKKSRVSVFWWIVLIVIAIIIIF